VSNGESPLEISARCRRRSPPNPRFRISLRKANFLRAFKYTREKYPSAPGDAPARKKKERREGRKGGPCEPSLRGRPAAATCADFMLVLASRIASGIDSSRSAAAISFPLPSPSASPHLSSAEGKGGRKRKKRGRSCRAIANQRSFSFAFALPVLLPSPFSPPEGGSASSLRAATALLRALARS